MTQPVMTLLDLLGRRHALRILWELRGPPLRFRPLAEAAGGLSPTTLSDRLTELEGAGIVERGPSGYALTPIGEELGALLIPLDAWARRNFG